MTRLRSALILLLAAPLSLGAHAGTRAEGAAQEPLDRLVYSSARGGNLDLWAANVDGTEQERLTTDPADDTQPDVSPDGEKIAFVRGSVQGSTPNVGYLWVMDADGSNARRLLNDPVAVEFRPDFSPDGAKILFSRFVGTAFTSELWVTNADGSGGATRIDTGAEAANYGSWSPDGKTIAHVGIAAPDIQVWVTRVDGSLSKPLTSLSRNVAPQWSPDGRYLSFTSFRNGDGEVFVMTADGGDQHLVASSPGKDGLATWSPDGTRIAFGSTRHTPCPSSLTEMCPHQIFTMRADGSDLTLVADNALSDMYPAYFPRPASG